MTKRRNPWHDESPFQLKTHISTREVAYGIDGGQYKNQIYGELFSLAKVSLRITRWG